MKKRDNGKKVKMSNLLSGLEKFGLDVSGGVDILKDDKNTKATSNSIEKKESKPKVQEKDLIIDKKVECPLCSRQVVYKSTLTTKLKRLEPDADLRPNFEGIDDTKYGVILCHSCGYAALTKQFEHVSAGQRKMIRAAVCDSFTPTKPPEGDTYTYDYAVERHKLALVTAMAKKAKLSEKSYICLKIAWLRRGQLENGLVSSDEEKKEIQEEEKGFYRQAYDGFMQVLSTEMPPFCGMDTQTVQFMLANMAMSFEEYDKAAKLVADLIVTPGVNRRIKDKCHDLKPVILAKIKESKNK